MAVSRIHTCNDCYLIFSKGNFEDIQDAGSLHEFLMDLHAEYGPLASFWWGTQLVVSIASPEMFDEVKALFDRPSTYCFD